MPITDQATTIWCIGGAGRIGAALPAVASAHFMHVFVDRLTHEFELLLATPIVKLTHEVELLLNHQTIIRAALAAGVANQGSYFSF